MTTNLMQVYFDLKEVERKLKELQETVAEVDTPELKDEKQLLIYARGYLDGAVEGIKNFLSIEGED